MLLRDAGGGSGAADTLIIFGGEVEPTDLGHEAAGQLMLCMVVPDDGLCATGQLLNPGCLENMHPDSSSVQAEADPGCLAV